MTDEADHGDPTDVRLTYQELAEAAAGINARLIAERTRADAVAAQRDLLAAVLRELVAVKVLGNLPYGNVDEFAAYTRREDAAWEVARAALADVRDTEGEAG